MPPLLKYPILAFACAVGVWLGTCAVLAVFAYPGVTVLLGIAFFLGLAVGERGARG